MSSQFELSQVNSFMTSQQSKVEESARSVQNLFGRDRESAMLNCPSCDRCVRSIQALVPSSSAVLSEGEWMGLFRQIRMHIVSLACFSFAPQFQSLSRLLPPLLDSLLLPSFYVLWTTLTPALRSTLQSSFSQLLSHPSFPSSLMYLPISIQAAVLEWSPFPSSVSFPFPFSPLIHGCFLFHFNESGVRFLGYAIHHRLPLSIAILPESIQMAHSLSATPLSSTLLQQFSEEPQLFSQTPDTADAQSVMEQCIELLGDWRYAKDYYANSHHSRSTVRLLQACFNLDDNRTILDVCSEQEDPSVTQYRVAALLNQLRFPEVIRFMHSKSPFPVEGDNGESSPRLKFFLALSRVITELSDGHLSQARSVAEQAIRPFTQTYLQSIRRMAVENSTVQPYLAMMSVLRLVLAGSLHQKEMVSLLRGIASHVVDSFQSWCDLFLFKESVRFLDPSGGQDMLFPPYSLRLDALPSEAVAERSSLLRKLFSQCRSDGQSDRVVPIGFLWSQLLRSEGNVPESLRVLQIVRAECRSKGDRFVEVTVRGLIDGVGFV